MNDSGRLNDRNRDYLSLGAGSSVTNSGYNTGIAVQDGEKYDFSVWARADAGTTLTVSLQDAGGSLATARRIAVTKSGWARYRATFTASRTSTTGRLTGAAAALDMVSLFPRDTYWHEPNGLRKDLAEDIGAMPLPVVPALVTGCGQNQAVDDDALLKRHIQDALDLIEFAKGARPDGPPRAVPPHPHRGRQRGAPAAAVLRYASQGNAFKNGLAEAAYLTGLERNADVVKLASYAPLFANEDSVQWRPDLVWFNNHASWGSANYEVSKPGSVDTGRACDIDIKVRGRQITLYLDGQQWGSFTDDKPTEPFRQVVTRDAKTGELIVKVVNDQSSAARTAIDLGGAKVASKAGVTPLRGDQREVAPQARQRSISSGGLSRKSAQKSAPNARTPASDTSSGTQVGSLNPALRRQSS